MTLDCREKGGGGGNRERREAALHLQRQLVQKCKETLQLYSYLQLLDLFRKLRVSYSFRSCIVTFEQYKCMKSNLKAYK